MRTLLLCLLLLAACSSPSESQETSQNTQTQPQIREQEPQQTGPCTTNADCPEQLECWILQGEQECVLPSPESWACPNKNPRIVPGTPPALTCIKRQQLICKSEQYDRTELAESLGFTCVEECPTDFIAYESQVGPLCIRDYTIGDLASWEICTRSCSDHACAMADRLPDGTVLEDGEYRCVPEEYENFLLQEGVELLDENGKRMVAIA